MKRHFQILKVLNEIQAHKDWEWVDIIIPTIIGILIALCILKPWL